MEPADTQALFLLENDPDNWKYTKGSQAPYTIEQIEHFVKTAPRDLHSEGQLRFVIEYSGELVGAIDLYDYDSHTLCAWVAVIVYPVSFRGQGIACAALRELIGKAASYGVVELRAEVSPGNRASQALFLSVGFSAMDGRQGVFSFPLLAEHLRVGRVGERLAERYLVGEGFEILERNWRSSTRGVRSAARHGEIDLIAQREGSLYFVEVKTRIGDHLVGDYSPQTAFTAVKVARLNMICEHYLRESDFSGEVFNALVVVNLLSEGGVSVRYFPVS